MTALLGKKRLSMTADKKQTEVIADGVLESVDPINDLRPTKATDPC